MKKIKNDNKGFTLVELIVVLVILAILAAILVPALLGYIDEAKSKQLELHGKSVYTAAQAVSSELYAKGIKPTDSSKTVGGKDANQYFADRIMDISDVDEFGSESIKVKIGFKSGSDKHAAYTVDYICYGEGETTGSGASATTTYTYVELTGGSWNSTTTPAADTTLSNPITITFAKSGTTWTATIE